MIEIDDVNEHIVIQSVKMDGADLDHVSGTIRFKQADGKYYVGAKAFND